jgi:hypothetical protein
LAARRANTIRRRLRWQPGILNGMGGKPKGMHWKTFQRLTALHKAHASRALAGIAASLGLSEAQPVSLRAMLPGVADGEIAGDFSGR